MADEDTTAGVVESTYFPGSAVDTFHNLPRFGHTNDFSRLFSSDEDEQVDYTLGLIFITSLLLSFFAFWQMVLFVFICMGPDRVGFLSGHHLVEPSKSNRKFLRPRRVRITFILCALLVMAFAVILVVQGFGNVQETATEVEESALEVESIAFESIELVKRLERVGDDSRPLRDQLVENLGNFCANPTLEQQTGVDFDELAKEAIENLELLEDFIANDVADLKGGVEGVKDASSGIAKGANQIESLNWSQFVFVSPLIVLPAFMIVGVLLSGTASSRNCYTCCQKWIFLPLFTIAVIVSWLFCSFFGIIAALNADFCSGGESEPGNPEESIRVILREQGYETNSIEYEAVMYYANSCSTKYPFDFVDEYETELEEALDSVTSLLTQIDQVGTETLLELCLKDFEPIRDLMLDLRENIENLIVAADAATNILGCERIRFIYENTVHDATCTFSVDGMAWMAVSLLIISVCGLTMITLRAALYDVEYDPDFIEPRSDPGVAPRLWGMSLIPTRRRQYDDEVSEESYETPALSVSQSKGVSESKTSSTIPDSHTTDEYEDESRAYLAAAESTKSWEKYPNALTNESSVA